VSFIAAAAIDQTQGALYIGAAHTNMHFAARATFGLRHGEAGGGTKLPQHGFGAQDGVFAGFGFFLTAKAEDRGEDPDAQLAFVDAAAWLRYDSSNDSSSDSSSDSSNDSSSDSSSDSSRVPSDPVCRTAERPGSRTDCRRRLRSTESESCRCLAG
jgi:hypothetical protein